MFAPKRPPDNLLISRGSRKKSFPYCLQLQRGEALASNHKLVIVWLCSKMCISPLAKTTLEPKRRQGLVSAVLWHEHPR